MGHIIWLIYMANMGQISHIKIITRSFWPIKSMIRTILCPTDPPIENSFRNAANMKTGMFELTVKMIATNICRIVQNIALSRIENTILTIFFRDLILAIKIFRDPWPVWLHWNDEINIQILDAQLLHQQNQTSTCKHSPLKSFHIESLHLSAVSL